MGATVKQVRRDRTLVILAAGTIQLRWQSVTTEMVRAEVGMGKCASLRSFRLLR